MINMYGLSYLMPTYLEKSLNSMIDNASEEVCFTVIDNKTKNSDLNFSIVKPLVDSGKVKRYIQLTQNDMLNGFNRSFALFPPDDSEKFFIFTELDLIVKGFDWIQETRRMQETANLSGFKLSQENYVPPNQGHVEDGISVGFWLMGLNTQKFYQVMNQSNGWNHPVQDHRLRSLMGTKARSDKELYHLGWDIWKDDPEYFDRKLKGIDWSRRTCSPLEFVYERQS